MTKTIIKFPFMVVIYTCLIIFLCMLTVVEWVMSDKTIKEAWNYWLDSWRKAKV